MKHFQTLLSAFVITVSLPTKAFDIDFEPIAIEKDQTIELTPEQIEEITNLKCTIRIPCISAPNQS